MNMFHKRSPAEGIQRHRAGEVFVNCPSALIENPSFTELKTRRNHRENPGTLIKDDLFYSTYKIVHNQRKYSSY